MQRSVRFLIICHYFPPLNSIASLRPYGFAKYWTEQGHVVTVLTTYKGIYKNQKFDIPGVNIVDLKYFGSNIIQEVKFKYSQESKNPLIKNISLRKLIAKIIFYLRKRYGIFAAERIPEIIFPWYFVARNYIRKNISKYDVVISEYSPPSALLLGAYAKKISGNRIKLIFDYRDSWTVSNYSQPGFPAIRLLEKWIENKLLNFADLIVSVQKGIQLEIQKKNKSISTLVVENGFFDDFSFDESVGLPEGFNVVYTGSYGGYRSLDFLAEALEIIRVEDAELYGLIKIYIVGEGILNDSHEKIVTIPKVSYEKSLGYQSKATVFILVESPKAIAKYNIPGKFFEYFRFSRPIIVFGPEKDFEISRYLAKHKIGLVAKSTPRDAANAFMYLYKNMNEFSGLELHKFSRKNKAEFLLSHILRI